MNKLALLIICATPLTLGVLAGYRHGGSIIPYLLFTVTFALLIIDGVRSGIGGYFFLSIFLWLVLVGGILMLFFVQAMETLANLLTQNPYVTAIWSAGIAQTVASFGLGIVQHSLYLFVCIVAMSFIWLIQRAPSTDR